MQVTDHINRSVSVRLEALEQFEYEGVTYPRDRVFKAVIRNVAASGTDLDDLTFMMEGFAINADGTAGMIQRRYQFDLAGAQTILPDDVLRAILNRFRDQRLDDFMPKANKIVSAS